jgi:hypothetical protein
MGEETGGGGRQKKKWGKKWKKIRGNKQWRKRVRRTGEKSVKNQEKKQGRIRVQNERRNG